MEAEIFTIDCKDQNLKAERFDVSGQTFFRISFPGQTAIAYNITGNQFQWQKVLIFYRSGRQRQASRPGGKQKLAEEIGGLIEKYYRGDCHGAGNFQ